MPIYTYKDNQGNTYEVFQSIKDKPLTHYKGKKVKRVLSTCSFILKGSGFYKNDY